MLQHVLDGCACDALQHVLNGCAFDALQAAEHELNTSVAYSLVKSWHETLPDTIDVETVQDIFNRALSVCLRTGNGALASGVMRIMKHHGFTPEDELINN